MKTIKFYTLGCKVNQYDAQEIREHFLRSGFKEIEDGDPASLYVINTCTVTHKADADSLNYLRRARRENPQAKIIVTGCLTELDSDKIRIADRRAIIVKNKNKEGILGYINDQRNTKYGRRNTNQGISGFKGHTRAFLKVQDGCDNFCSYCKVPLVRGKSRSKPLKEIAREAERLEKNGFKEIVLTGICLGSYGKDIKPRANLIDIIDVMESIGSVLRIRFSSIETADVTQELIEKIATSKKVCPHLHIPIQSGDDAILKKMNRRYTRSDYIELIKKIRSCVPQIAITTDVLVGFPGENETNFRNTLGLVKKISPLKVHIFPYSERQNTHAASLGQKLDPVVVRQRMLRLKKVSDVCALAYKKRFLAKLMPVLIEGRSKENLACWEGYTDNYIKVLYKSKKDLKNQLIPLRLKKIEKDYFLASRP